MDGVKNLNGERNASKLVADLYYSYFDYPSFPSGLVKNFYQDKKGKRKFMIKSIWHKKTSMVLEKGQSLQKILTILLFLQTEKKLITHFTSTLFTCQ